MIGFAETSAWSSPESVGSAWRRTTKEERHETSVWTNPEAFGQPSRGALTGRSSPSIENKETHWKQLHSALQNFKELGEDWDGNGASKPGWQLIAAADRWLQFMERRIGSTPPDSVMPGSLGEIVFVWQRPGLFIEATIEDETTVQWMTEIGDRFEHFTSTPDIIVAIEYA